MRKSSLSWTIAAAMLTACRDAAPQPSFEQLFPEVTGELLTRSSPTLIDLTRDGVPDIVFGTGVERLQPGPIQYVLPEEPTISGYVVAVSGA
ncbi:MAG TPA: hypothetical protein VK864_10760, partial [Longimicrobiales bacterium]|nr:hypothetical protein [Longimicrobiales bacterium]